MATKNKYELTKEHRARFGEWRDRWIANAMSTDPMDAAERDIVRRAIIGLYEAGGKKPPPPERIVFVPSPAAAFASGREATDAATYVATDAATREATDAATDAATAADLAADRNWWRLGGCAPADMPVLAGQIAGHAQARAMLMCATTAYYMHDGGEQWSGWSAYLSSFRHAAGLDIDYSKWDHYEQCAIHSGPRYMHEEFCIVSDRPDILLVDEANRPHCATGPFCRWRDGSSLYAVHGVRVPWWVIEHKDRITPQLIDGEANAEVRRVMIEMYGQGRYLRDSGAKLLHESGEGIERRRLWRREFPDDEPLVMVELVNSTPEPDQSRKTYFLRVPPDQVDADAAVAWTFDMSKDDYRPVRET